MSCCESCEKGNGCAAEASAAPSGDPGVISILERAPSDLVEDPFLVGGVSIPLVPGEAQKVAWRLAVGQNEQNVTQAYELGDCDQARFGIVVLSVQSGSLSFITEGSLDKANWQSSTISSGVSAIGYRSVTLHSSLVTMRYVRLRMTGSSMPGFSIVLSLTVAGRKTTR